MADRAVAVKTDDTRGSRGDTARDAGAKKRPQKQSRREARRWVREAKGILALAFAGFAVVALYAYDPRREPLDQSSPVGPIGAWLGGGLFWAFGYAGYLLPGARRALRHRGVRAPAPRDRLARARRARPPAGERDGHPRARLRGRLRHPGRQGRPPGMERVRGAPAHGGRDRDVDHPARPRAARGALRHADPVHGAVARPRSAGPSHARARAGHGSCGRACRSAPRRRGAARRVAPGRRCRRGRRAAAARREGADQAEIDARRQGPRLAGDLRLRQGRRPGLPAPGGGPARRRRPPPSSSARARSSRPMPPR